MHIKFFGDIDTLSKYIGMAKQKLSLVKSLKKLLKTDNLVRTFILNDDIKIKIKSNRYDDIIELYGSEETLYIIAYVGITTAYSFKKFYKIEGNKLNEIDETEIPYTLIDDGYINSAVAFDQNSLLQTCNTNSTTDWKIPAPSNGISAKKLYGSTLRYIPSQNFENEYIVNMSSHLDCSLYNEETDTSTNYIYHIKYCGPFLSNYSGIFSKGLFADTICKYEDNSIIFSFMITDSIDANGVINYRTLYNISFLDDFNIQSDILSKNIKSGELSLIKKNNYLGNEILGYFYKNKNDTKYIVYNVEGVDTQLRIVNTFISTDIYNNDTKVSEYKRCSLNNFCKYRKSQTNQFWCNYQINPDGTLKLSECTSLKHLNNNFIIPYKLTENGMDYIEVEVNKDSNDYINSYRYKLFCNSKLIADTGQKSTVIPNNSPIENIESSKVNGIVIFPEIFNLVNSFHNKSFDVALYRKATFSDIKFYDTDYYTMYGTGANKMYGVEIISKIEVILNVNGSEYVFPYNATLRELTLIPNIKDHTQEEYQYIIDNLKEIYNLYNLNPPTANFGYDYFGNPTNENNYALIREFMDADDDYFFFSIDVFPISVRHQLKEVKYAYNMNGHEIIYIPYFEYSDDYPFPYSSDGKFNTIPDRIWLLFDKNGNRLKLETPKKEDGTIWNRLNGVCFFVGK